MSDWRLASNWLGSTVRIRACCALACTVECPQHLNCGRYTVLRDSMVTMFWLLPGIVLGTAFLAFARAQSGAEERVLAY